ncbi:DUF4214 domain-containing protein [Methylobacterium soli]|uniref:DUF4214 domain-containing protein n=1 Tax=Methylobacterium soli TaxID=553447 RepID=A0A6L3SQS1_9HYPH|nr:DUF4214 domain-containing protein [Methylobacterium soli]KAB1073817.1 DUF4214 domain-containing protein [Methylobacterium soli]GJE44810.1 hypothetical protein AEGHOMDF_4001 [Methylobacterium soli]
MTHTIDGSLTDWTSADRLDLPGLSRPGLALYGTYEAGQYVFGLSTGTAIGAGTTFWLNTDRNAATGAQAFAGAETGAEFYVDFRNDPATAKPVPYLYKLDSAGAETFLGAMTAAYSADETTVEFSVPSAALAQTVIGLDLKIDVNNDANATLPLSYGGNTLTVKDPASLPPVTAHPLKIGIVYSETSAKAYFGGGDAGEMSYSHLFMAAQNQATAAGIPFDVLSEGDLTNLAKISGYDALVFPSFRNVPADKVAAIQDVLTDAVYKYHVGLITAGDFMTNGVATTANPLGDPIAGDPYIRMKTLLDVTRVDGASGAGVDVKAGDLTNPMLDGYTANEQIRHYDNFSTSWYGSADGAAVSQIATQNVTLAGATSAHNAVIGTVTGAKNVHFASESFLGDNNMLQHAIDYIVDPASGPNLSLHMSRDKAIVASRTDMDQAMEIADVTPVDGSDGIYKKLQPILDQWKKDYNFVGSYYVDVGDGTDGRETNWDVSGPFYKQLLAAGNEIGSHSLTHPDNTNGLTSEKYASEFGTSRDIINAKLGITIQGAAVPGAPEFLPASKAIEQYYSYISGGAALVGAGYPGAIGHLTPDDGKVYIAPNMSFDFTLVGFQKKTAAEASDQWQAEFKSLISHSDMPVVVWPWHDYGPTNWVTDENIVPSYNTAMYTNLIKTAYEAGSEFVTLGDLAQRVASFDASSLTYGYDAATSTLSASVHTPDAGKFALNLGDLGTSKIKGVTGWYAYDDDSVFVDRDGGDYKIVLGATQDDVTHLYDIADRAELVNVSGDGTNLTFTAVGEGTYLIDLADPAGRTVEVKSETDPNLVKTLTGDKLAITLTGLGSHTVAVTMVGSTGGGGGGTTDPGGGTGGGGGTTDPGGGTGGGGGTTDPGGGGSPGDLPNRSSFGTVSHDVQSPAGEVYALYDAIFDRPSDPVGQQYWTNALNTGMSLHELAATLLASPEGQAHLPATDSVAFIESLYQSALHRGSDSEGLQYWLAALDHGADRADLAGGFALSTENVASIQSALDIGIFTPDLEASQVARLYYGLLDRAPDASGLHVWTAALEGGTALASIAQGFLASGEYAAKFAGLTDAAYIEALYDGALGRHAEANGLQGWTSALANGATRAEVAVGIAESSEAQNHLLSQIESGWHLVA